MKTIPKNNSWQVFTSKLNEFWSKSSSVPRERVVSHDAGRKASRFRTWSPKIRMLNPSIFEGERSKINIQVLERFIKEISLDKMSYQSFISSHLQQLSIDTQSASTMKKNLAVERMLALVSSTLSDMKKIDSHSIAKSQG